MSISAGCVPRIGAVALKKVQTLIFEAIFPS